MECTKKGAGRNKSERKVVRQPFPVVPLSGSAATLIPALLAALAAASTSTPSVKRLSAHEKARLGMFLSMRELSVVTGYGENKLNELKKQEGFPLFQGKTTLERFHLWAFAQASPAAPATPQPNRVPPVLPEGNRYEPFR